MGCSGEQHNNYKETKFRIVQKGQGKGSKQGNSVSYLCDPSGTLEIESLSMLLEVTLESLVPSKVLFVQLTGTRTPHARKAIGTKILSLHKSPRETA